MKCLSIRQPYAFWVCTGAKDVENRSWKTNFRGPLLIHAGLQFAEGVTIGCENGIFLTPDFFDLDRGAIVGRVNLVDCVQDHTSRWATDGSWHWVLTDPVLFSSPIPYKGRLGLFDVPDGVVGE